MFLSPYPVIVTNLPDIRSPVVITHMYKPRNVTKVNGYGSLCDVVMNEKLMGFIRL